MMGRCHEQSDRILRQEWFGIRLNVQSFYDAYIGIRRRKGESCIYLLDKLRECLIHKSFLSPA